MVPVVRSRLIRFGVFEVDFGSGELFKSGHKVRIEEQPFRVLSILLEKPGQLVTRKELQQRLWPQDTFVDFEHSLNVDIQRLRHVLGDSAENPGFIETLPRRGYRFIYPLERLPLDTPSPIPSPSPSSMAGLSSSTTQPDASLPQAEENVLKPFQLEMPAVQVAPGISRPEGPGVDESRVGEGAPLTDLWRRTVLAQFSRNAGRWRLWLAGILAVVFVVLSLAWWGSRRPAPPPELKQRRLTTNSSENPVSGGAISPDGKYFAYADSAGIHLQLIETHEERLLAKGSGVPSDAGWFNIAWFPDGTRLLATLSEAGERPSAWVVSVLGGNTRRLRDDAISMSVSPDGSHIAYTSGSGQNTYREIWLMSPQGERPERVLGLDENNFALRVEWGPDSRRMAYWKQFLAPDRVENSIETCTIKGTEHTVVVVEPRLASFCWIPQGYIVYSRVESLAPTAIDSNLWKIPVVFQTGKPAGDPTKFTNWAGFEIRHLSASADGKRITFNKRTVQAQVYVGELEAGGTGMKPPRRLTLDEAADYPSAWTGDGKAVLFYSDRSGSAGLYEQDIDQATAQTLLSGADILGDVRLSPDGSWLLYVVGPEEIGSSTAVRVMRMPIHGGSSQLVLEGKNVSGPMIRCTRAPATFCAIGEMSLDMKDMIISSFDPLKGRGGVLKTVETDSTARYDWDLAADGSKLALYKLEEREAHIRLLSLVGGEDREMTVKGWGGLESMDWSPDGRVFYCGSVSSEAATLLRIDMGGLATVLWRKKGAVHTHGVPSPDGRRLAVMGWVMNSNHWMVEGF